MNKKIKTLLVSSMVVLTAAITLGCDKEGKEPMENILSIIKSDTGHTGDNKVIDDNTIVEYVKKYFDIEILPEKYKIISSYAKRGDNYTEIIAVDKNHKNKLYFLTLYDEDGKQKLVELYKKGVEEETIKSTRDEKIDIAKKFLVEKDFATSEKDIDYIGIDNEASAGGDKVGFQFEINNERIVVSVSNTDSKVCHISMNDTISDK